MVMMSYALPTLNFIQENIATQIKRLVQLASQLHRQYRPS